MTQARFWTNHAGDIVKIKLNDGQSLSHSYRWHEMECGDGSGCIERDDITGKPLWRGYNNARVAYSIPDREKGALKRLASIMVRYPSLGYYVQGDPRGASLYILRPGDVPEGKEADAYYSRGIAVFK